MFQSIKNLFARMSRNMTLAEKIDAMAQEAMEKIDFDNPSERVGVRIYFVLTRQFELIGKRDGNFPYTSPFASDKARGALLGTAIALVRQECDGLPNDIVTGAAITAFCLAYGRENGEIYALQTMNDSADGNEDVNFASDWAIADTDGASGDDSPTTPAAFYLAVAKMI